MTADLDIFIRLIRWAIKLYKGGHSVEEIEVKFMRLYRESMNKISIPL